MSADLLREAAESIRDEWADADPGIKPTAFYLAVADWLEETADHMGSHRTYDRALAVARAYLGSEWQ